MIYKIQHSLTYEFSAPVYLEPHLLYLKPRSDAAQRLMAFDLVIDPQPVLVSHNLDTAGNPEIRVWFQGLTHYLHVQAVSLAETLRTNPFDYLAYPGSCSLPARYTPSAGGLLRTFRRKRHHPTDIRVFSAGVAREAGGDTLVFLTKLAQTISRSFRKIRRQDGPAWPPMKTLSTRSGACRDLAMLFIACCAEQGLAARFVSGYCGSEEAQRYRHELHGWVEVYLEGGGWRGFDPMNGTAAADRHVALMAAPSARHTAPVQGRFRGGQVQSQMRFSVTLAPQDAPAVSLFQQQQQQ